MLLVQNFSIAAFLGAEAQLNFIFVPGPYTGNPIIDHVSFSASRVGAWLSINPCHRAEIKELRAHR